jgi:hypothetical protein
MRPGSALRALSPDGRLTAAMTSGAQFSRDVVLPGEEDALAVEIMVGLAEASDVHLDQEMAQLRGRKTGADDRAMRVFRQLPRSIADLYLAACDHRPF